MGSTPITTIPLNKKHGGDSIGVNMYKMVNWSKNSVHRHNKKGNRLGLNPFELLEKALHTINTNQGCCPQCGREMCNEHNHPHQLTVHRGDNGEACILCNSCHRELHMVEQRMDFLNSK